MANTIQDKLAYLAETKEAIKQSIIAKGVSVSDSDTFRSYANKIGSIETGGGTSDCSVSACFDEVGYTFVPIYIQKGIETAAQFKTEWNPSNTSINITGYKDSMVFFPKIDTSNVTTLNSVFKDTSILVFPNNDFPNLSGDNSLEYTFKDCTSIKSIDFGNLNEDVVYSLNYTFQNCNLLSRIWVNNPNTKFKISSHAFENCKSLDENECNIFDYIDYDDADVSYIFSDSKLIADIILNNPTNLKNAFYCSSIGEYLINNKNITINYSKDFTNSNNSYLFNTFDSTSISNELTNTLKITGSPTLSCNQVLMQGSVYDIIKPLFDTIDVTGFSPKNTYSNSLSHYFGNLYANKIIGISSYTDYESPNPSRSFYYMIELLVRGNTLKEFPNDEIEQYYTNNKSIIDSIIWGNTSHRLLYDCYRIDGLIDLSMIPFKFQENIDYVLYSTTAYKRTNITLRLDNADFSNVKIINISCFSNKNIVALYMPFNFNAYTGTIDFSRLSGWTDHDSLIWSLLTHSTDRATQGLGTQTIKLSANSYNALTEDERNQIKAKGYTLSQ